MDSEASGCAENCDGELWEVFWCFDGWEEIRERLETLLPPWARIKKPAAGRNLADQVGNADVLVPTTAFIGADVIAGAKRLKGVVHCATGYDNIAIDECAKRNIPVCHFPGANAVSTAEGALCCILMLARRVREQQRSFQEGILGLPLAMQLYDRTLGIVGFGKIGKHLATIAKAMGMKVLFTNSKSSDDDLAHLLRESDVVTLHCPLTAKTTKLIGKEELAMMKAGALLVNYSRGPVLDEEAVTEAVFSGKLGGLGLDVYWIEPESPDKPLYRHPRVVTFPHSGPATGAVMDLCAQFIADNVVRLRSGKDLVTSLVVKKAMSAAA